MDFFDSPFLESVFSLTEGILATGTYLFRTLFYSLGDWLNLQPDSGVLSWLDSIATLLGLDWLIENSFVELIFSPEGIWTILTILLAYFIVP